MVIIRRFPPKVVRKWAGKTGLERAQLLESSTAIAEIHADTASKGQTTAPKPTDPVGLHFTCFVHAPSSGTQGVDRMLELDGERTGPVDRGVSENLLEDAARYIREAFIGKDSSHEFGIVALTPAIDL